jgi:ferredoxin
VAHIVDGECINCLHKKCVVVCPVNCFHLGRNMIVVDPTECIDCGLCVESCPANAIRGLNDPSPKSERNQYWADFNSYYARIWPRISDIAEEVREDARGVPLQAIDKAGCLRETSFIPPGKAGGVP